MVGPDPLVAGVEILVVASEHLDGADAEANRSGIQQVEIDEVEQSVSERSRVVDADRRFRSLRAQHGWRYARCEEPRYAGQRRKRGARLVEHAPGIVILGKWPAREPARHAIPKGSQAFDALLRWIAGDDRGIDGADRDTRDPAGHLAGLRKSLVSSGLIGTERSAALEHENCLLVKSRHDWRTIPRRSLRLWPSPFAGR